MSPAQLVLAGLAVGLGATVQGSVGFGLALISVPLLIIIDPRLVPGPMLCDGIVLTFLLAWRERRSIDFHHMGWALAGRFPGTGVGAAALVLFSRQRLDLAFSILVLVAVAVSLLPWRVRPTRVGLIGAGVLSGFMATTVAMGGPPMALLLQNVPGARVRGTLSGFFVVGASVSLAAVIGIGRFGRTELGLALALLPGILAGFLLSSRTAPLLDRGYTRPAILALAGAMGLVALLKALI